MFKHNICGSQPYVPDGMPNSSDPLPSEFYVNPMCPQVPIVIRAMVVEADPIELAKDLEEKASVGDQS